MLLNIPTREFCGVECGIFENFGRYCFSLFHNDLLLGQEWNKQNGDSSSSLQYKQRGKSTFLNLKSILFKYKTLFNNLYRNIILRFVFTVTRLGNKKMFFNQGQDSERFFQSVLVMQISLYLRQPEFDIMQRYSIH